MTEKRKMNHAQNEAVKYTDGPLLIVAGAGTGKTTVIANKIGYLLENDLAKPEEILALTFTDKAAEEMQTRVDEIIDTGYTDLQISTFHSFCQRILEHHAIDIGLSNQFKLLTPTAAWLLMQKHFRSFNLDYYRPLGNPYRHIHELLKHFSKCKDELISPEDYLFLAEAKGKEKGDMVIEEQNRLTEISNAYHVYNQLLRDNAALDFGDLIYYTHELFRKRPNVLQIFQQQYKYILVDEFQDVNWGQYALLRQLVIGGKGRQTPPNLPLERGGSQPQLTVVGDDDQSIYAFRGASVSNILHFKDDFPKAKEIVLNENYRSVQPILDLAYQSIKNNNPDRLEVKLNIDKKLISQRYLSPTLSFVKERGDKPSPPQRRGQGEVVHINAPTLDNEVEDVINEIARLKKIDRKASWDDFAILVRANNHADPFIGALERHGLPYEFLSSAGLFRQNIVLDCLAFLRILNNYHIDAAWYRLLCLPFLNFKESDLQKLTHFAKQKSIPYYAALKRGRELDLSEGGLKTCDTLIALAHEEMQKTRTDKPSALLVAFLEKIGYLKFLVDEEKSGNRESNRRTHHLTQFFEFLNEFETTSPDHRLVNFLEHFELLSEAGEKGSMSQPSDTPDSINIMTIHGSKGLEFKYVFVVNLVEDRFPSRRRGEAIEIPVELVKEKLPEGDSHIEEERRLFYVAVTRAKDRLYLTSANDYGGERAKKISRFLNELGYHASDEEKKKFELKTTEKIPEKKGEFIFDLPKSFSFSQIRSYDTCPYKYKLSSILKIPTKGSGVLSFGSSIHNTLLHFYSKVKELNEVQQVSLFDKPLPQKTSSDKIKVPSLDELLEMYEKDWIDDWYRDEQQRELYFKKGKELLKLFYSKNENNWNIPAEIEKSFRIKIGPYLVKGRIDRIDKNNDGGIEIIDYKTGKSKDKLTAEDKEQLLIYQIVFEQVRELGELGKPSKLTFYYLEDDLRTSFIGEPKDLEKLQKKLLGTMDKIYEKNFTATPSQFACGFCDFKEICEYRV